MAANEHFEGIGCNHLPGIRQNQDVATGGSHGIIDACRFPTSFRKCKATNARVVHTVNDRYRIVVRPIRRHDDFGNPIPDGRPQQAFDLPPQYGRLVVRDQNHGQAPPRITRGINGSGPEVCDQPDQSGVPDIDIYQAQQRYPEQRDHHNNYSSHPISML